jgi:hypothetical protein
MPDVTDELGRPAITPDLKAAIDHAFDGVQGRGALLVIADEHGTRAQLAGKLNGHWKVAGGGGMTWSEKKPYGFIGIEATW